jgi:hypothetical protein
LGGFVSVDNPLVLWLQSTTFLFDLDVVKKAYDESYRLLPADVQKALQVNYLQDIFHSLDLLLCMLPYRDLQYGPRSKGGKREIVELRRRMKLGWVAYNINAIQKLLNTNNWDVVKKELWDWYNSKGHQFRDQEGFEGFIEFLKGYLQTTIAELSVLYVYLYNDRPLMPLGFMQHLITLGPSGPTLGDFIDVKTLTFVEVKSNRASVEPSSLLSLTINTRLPSAIAIPRYEVDVEKGVIDENRIVVEFYTLTTAGKKRPWIIPDKEKDLKADVIDELKPLMQNISILRENAKYYLEEIKQTSNISNT